ncbi:hypothetical protein ACIBP6_38355 [Nonomuraea terrae]|uniref:hypothetical protein n=1 Tax=Nonomuraea terrae TaxID=2530383 RepID=UPI00378B79F9
MLKSQAWRRRARKTSALGLMSTLVVFVCSVFLTATPAQAATLRVTYNCTGGALADSSVAVTVSTPTSVEPNEAAEIKWTFEPITTSAALTASTQVTVTGGDLEVEGGTPATVEGRGTGSVNTAVQSGLPYTPPEMTETVTVTATTGGNLELAPVTTASTTLLTIVVGTQTTNCTYVSASPTSVSVPVQTGNGNGNGTGTDLVQYECVGPGASETQDVEIKVTLTMPTSARVGQQMSIKWRGTYTPGKELKAPTTTGTTISPRIFAYASLSGITGLTSATGEGATGTITAGAAIPLPTQDIDLKTTANTAGTATVKPADVNFGANSSTGNTGTTQSAIECTVQNDTELKTYTLTVGNGTASPSPSPTTTSPRPTRTATATVTITPSSTTTTRRSQTPVAGADTGAGGMMGPDGRMFILTGTALITAAAVGGLVMRRRSIRS